jgi:putative transposase
MKKAMRRYGSPNEIVTDKLRSYSAAAKELGCLEKQVTSDGQTTELRIHIYPFDDEKGQCFGLGACTVYRSSHQSTPRFTICSTHKGHSQNAVLSSLNRDAALTEWRSLLIS